MIFDRKNTDHYGRVRICKPELNIVRISECKLKKNEQHRLMVKLL